MGIFDRIRSAVSAIRSDAADPVRTDGYDLSAFSAPSEAMTRDISVTLPHDLTHRIIWVVPEDALSDGWEVSSDTEQDTTRDDDEEWGLETALLEAAGLARYGDGYEHGGAFLWLVYADADDLSQPPSPGMELQRVHALSCTELDPLTWEKDPTSFDWGTPKTYQMKVSRGMLQMPPTEIHASRLVYIPGLRRARKHGDDESHAGRDWSAIRIYTEAIQGVDQGWRSGGRLLQKRAIPSLTLTDAAMASGSDLQAWLKAFRKGLTVDRMALIPPNSTFSFQGPSVSGTGELVAVQGWRMATPEGIPLTKLFGQPPAGLSTDDEAASKTYNALISAKRKDYARALLTVYERALGPDPSRRVVWPPLDEPTEVEAAQAALARAQRDEVLVRSGIILEDEVRSRFEGGEESRDYTLDEAAWQGAADDSAMDLQELMPPMMEEPGGEEE